MQVFFLNKCFFRSTNAHRVESRPLCLPCSPTHSLSLRKQNVGSNCFTQMGAEQVVLFVVYVTGCQMQKNLCVLLCGMPYLPDWSIEAHFVPAHARLLQQCLTLGYSMQYSPLGSSVHRILQARVQGCHALLQGTLLIQGSNLHLLCPLPTKPPGKPMKHVWVLHILSFFLHYLFVYFLFTSSCYSIFRGSVLQQIPLKC